MSWGVHFFCSAENSTINEWNQNYPSESLQKLNLSTGILGVFFSLVLTYMR